MARGADLPDRPDLDQPDPRLYRPARARHAAVVLGPPSKFRSAAMRRKFPFDRDKFKRLARYLTWRTSASEAVDAIGLQKALWLAEARMFMLHARPITGAVYIRDGSGPRAQRAGAV